MKNKILNFGLFLCLATAAYGELSVKVSSPKITAQKAVVQLAMTNTFDRSIESARATVFLSDEHGKMIGASTHWVIGGKKGRAALKSGNEATFNFVVNTAKPVTSSNITAKVLFNRVVMEDGNSIDVRKDVQVTAALK